MLEPQPTASTSSPSPGRIALKDAARAKSGRPIWISAKGGRVISISWRCRGEDTAGAKSPHTHTDAFAAAPLSRPQHPRATAKTAPVSCRQTSSNHRMAPTMRLSSNWFGKQASEQHLRCRQARCARRPGQCRAGRKKKI